MHYSAASPIHPTNTRHVCCPVCLTWRCLCWIISRFFVKVRIKMWWCLPWQCVGVSTVCGTLPLRRLASSQAPLSADTSLKLRSSFYKILWCPVFCVWPYSLTAFLPLYPSATFAPVNYAILVCPHLTIQDQLKGFFKLKFSTWTTYQVVLKLKFCSNRTTTVVDRKLTRKLKRLSTCISRATRWLFIEAKNISNGTARL